MARANNYQAFATLDSEFPNHAAVKHYPRRISYSRRQMITKRSLPVIPADGSLAVRYFCNRLSGTIDAIAESDLIRLGWCRGGLDERCFRSEVGGFFEIVFRLLEAISHA